LEAPRRALFYLRRPCWALKPQFGAGPGFRTLRKKSIELQTRQPAVVRLAHTSIAFAGSSSNPAYSSVVDGLLGTLDTEMMNNEKTLTKKRTAAEADWLLGLKVTGLRWAHRKPAPQIAAVIRNANVEFDTLDNDTLVAIAKAKLPLSLENEMRKKVGAPLRTTAPAAAPAKKK
jgi:hypothetical protein